MLTTNDNRFAQRAINALMCVIETLLPDDKEGYPHHADDAIKPILEILVVPAGMSCAVLTLS